MAKRAKNLFWPSYTDLMTSLFFIMLVLYILTTMLLQRQTSRYKEMAKDNSEIVDRFKRLAKEKEMLADQYRSDAEEFRKNEDIRQSVKKLEDSEYMIHQPEYKRFVIDREIEFENNSSRLPTEDLDFLMHVGMEIQSLVSSNQYDNVTYLLIIEGMASADGRASARHNYELSYRRAYSLYTYWRDVIGLKFNNVQCEVLISGSGIGGVGRDNVERKNRRFLIQVIPKIAPK
ncbi:hypothetical protein [Pontibacter sp. G13]|uniref:hypothetical protein n=1 Tax=Pontibacter sp. G13 TaxID=3074898 RepID=UPI00288A6A12|nr:hypothetical protein [Pontibacter sp. G13]WNJ20046.1 hypothetical protein RJD25_06140 [Pontibacter sp. G13]